MNETLRHRGPDDSGLRVFDLSESQNDLGKPGTIGLAHRRLSVIDPSPAGHQPMSNEDNTIWIVFNGEIYNFAGLRANLKRNHAFKGHSDTEVIVHLYEEIGDQVFSNLQGMFSIALYDSRRHLLLLARDRMGKKPLYWSIQGRTLLFGSELKALMVHPSFKKEIDLESLNKYFLYEYVPTPHTIFKNTWKLEPGTFLAWNGQTATKSIFWTPTFLPKSASFGESLASLDQALQAAVTDRLVSDVPLGIFLSGGIDSSTVAYYASKAGGGKVKTFSIGFREASFDESHYSRLVAEHLGTEHYERILPVHHCVNLIAQIAEFLDEPMADASIVPTYLLSGFTREHVTVALGGDGGDELFCGYDTFLAHRLARLYEGLPLAVRHRVIRPLVSHLPTSYKNMSFDFRLKTFVRGFDGNRHHRNQRWLSAFEESEREKLFSSGVWEQVSKLNEFDDIDLYIEKADSDEFYDQLTLVYERLYMMEQILVKVDRASMMHSLEVRAPFLDTRVVELANHMPAPFKFKGLTRKYILKKLMENRLPRDIVYRKKKGFGMPISDWLRGGLKPFVADCLGSHSIAAMGLFNERYVNGILAEHFSGKKDNRKQIWTLLIFALWWRRWAQ
jgi:asparagine synthase (glutamine-hydrolysing)